MASSLKTPSYLHKRRDCIDQIESVISGQERQAYTPLKNLLCDDPVINLPVNCVVTDCHLPYSDARPDLAIWLEDVPTFLRNEQEHLYCVIEVKGGKKVLEGKDKLAKDEIETYRFERVRFFYLTDSFVVYRYDLRIKDEIPEPRIWTWEDLKSDETKFTDCFTPLTKNRRTLHSILDDFINSEIPKGEAVTESTRPVFINSIVTVARILSRAILEMVDTRLCRDLREALSKIKEMEVKYGEATYDWSKEEYIDFTFPPVVEKEPFKSRNFNIEYAYLLNDIEPYKYALRAEFDQMKLFATRTGLNAADTSFLKNNDDAIKAREAFVQETATLLFSRLVMIRFSEDHELLKKYLSNGGLKAWIHYADHFKIPYNRLVQEAYRHAKPLFRHLFESKTLDWIVELETEFDDYMKPVDEPLSFQLLHAMWLLVRWDFSTVHGDILVGVYDKFLEKRQRKYLGEIYTRPELARYMLEACKWNGTQKILDPACGSGTFLVEAFDQVQRWKEKIGIGFTGEDAIDLLGKIHGLDINEFSATLAKIQLLWHVLSLVKNGGKQVMRDAIRKLNIEGGLDSLDTYGTSMLPDEGFIPEEAHHENNEIQSLKVTTGRLNKAYGGKFRELATNNDYDIVVGNPPYVRIHRLNMDTRIRGQYREIAHKQTDLSAFFVYRALRWWLKDGGRMALFLPLAITEAAYAERLRSVVEEYKIVEIVDLELLRAKVFHGSAVVTVILILEKSRPSPKNRVKLTIPGEECYDPKNDRIDMEKSKKTFVKRSELSLARYLPKIDTSEIEDDEGEGVSDSTWLTKILSSDVPLLDKISNLPILSSIIATGYVKGQGSNSIRSLDVPDQNRGINWKPKKVMEKGIMIGGILKEQGKGLPIFKGDNVFPDGIMGEPLGIWSGDVSQIKEVRYYLWKDCLNPSKTFVFRGIALTPIATQHPVNVYFQNTVFIVQLMNYFHLNVYLLSRVPIWFTVKTGRAGIMSSSFRSHWLPRNISRIPIPDAITDSFNAELERIGNVLFAIDHELQAGIQLLDQYKDFSRLKSKKLRERDDLFTSGEFPSLKEISYPADESNWENVEIEVNGDDVRFVEPGRLFPATQSGTPMILHIPNENLRRWVIHNVKERISEEKLPDFQWLRNLPIPNDLDEAIRLIDRIEGKEAEKELEVGLNELDRLVAIELGINNEELEYIQLEMKTDPLLKQLRPAWRHLTKRHRRYKEYGLESRY